MKTTSPFNSPSRRLLNRPRMLLAVGVFCVAFGAGFGFISFVPGISRTLAGAAAPIYAFQNDFSATAARVFALVGPKSSLVLKNESLRRQLLEQEVLLLDRTLLEAEVEELKGMLGRDEDIRITLARPLSSPRESAYDTLLIDRGVRHGVFEGQYVGVGGALVGVVSATYPETAQVTLFSAPGQELDVIIGELEVAGTATGQGGGNFEVTLPRGADVLVGDDVILRNFPGKIIGRVMKVTEKEEDTFMRLSFRLPINLTELLWLEIFEPR